MFKLSTKFGPNMKILAFPISILVVLFVLLIIFANKGVALVKDKISESKKVRIEEQYLKTKLTGLQNIPLETLDSGEVVVVALPSRNPGVWLTSQVRRTSRDTEVDITKVSVSSVSESEGIFGSEFSFEVQTDDYVSLLTFLKDLTVYLPVSYLQTVKAQKYLDLITMELSGHIYWSDFPKTLPPLTEPLQELSTEDNFLLSEISNFKMPVFTELDPTDPQERLNPFN